ncbi:MAG: sporulation transcriptional regulator SpoIIID [Thermoproteota archaeon]|nr:sporulation transcriptional regulator SpoIIID [Thermoproteota archaeon]
MTEDHIEWRRSKVMELPSQGYSERETATKLQVSKTTIHKDLVYLRKEAQESLQHRIHEVVPEEYQRCMTGIKQNLRHTLEIADSAADPRVKLQARSIANDCYHSIMDLCTNAGIVSDAIKAMEKKLEQLDTMQKIDERIEEIEEDETTSGIF